MDVRISLTSFSLLTGTGKVRTSLITIFLQSDKHLSNFSMFSSSQLDVKLLLQSLALTENFQLCRFFLLPQPSSHEELIHSLGHYLALMPTELGSLMEI